MKLPFWRRKPDAALAAARLGAERRKLPQLEEIGRTGLRLAAGLVMEDYNPELRAPGRYDIFDKMLSSDGQAQAVEFAICLPIESLNWWIEPASDDRIDQEVAEHIHTNLMEGMTSTWGGFVSEAMMGVMMGVSLVEKVWEIRDNMTWLRKLAPRHPRTVQRWIMDKEQGCHGIVQRITGDDGKTRDQPIDIEKLLRFSWRERAGNPEGRAVMRPMYRHWWCKDLYYRVANLGIYRFWLPALFGMLPSGATDDDKLAYLRLLESIRAADAGGAVLPSGYEKPFTLEAALRIPDIMALINHHDLMMARAALVQFLNLGSTDVGSWALSDSHVTFFLMSEQRAADWISEIVDRYLIPQMVGYNYPGHDQFPHAAHTPVSHVLQRGAIAEALNGLATATLVTPDRDTEDTLREMYDLPPKPEEEEAPETPETIPQEDVGASRQYRPRARRVRPPARTAQRQRIRLRARDQDRFDRTDRSLAAAKDAFQRDMMALVKRQHAELKKQLEPLLERFRKSDDLSKGKHIREMQKIDVPLVGTYENLIGDWLRDFYAAARDEAAKAAGVEPSTTIPNAVRTWLATKAQVIAQKHGEALRAAVLLEVLETVRKEIPTDRLLWNVEQISRKRASLDVTEDLVAAGRELTDLINSALAEAELPAEPEE